MSVVSHNGRLLVAAGRGLFALPAASGGEQLPEDLQPGTPQAGSPTTMVLSDFYSTHQYARPVVQRKAGKDYANVPVLFTFTGTAPGNPQARVVNAVGGAVVKDWTTLANISVVGSNGLGTLPTVPQGGYYLIELRDGHNPATSATNSSGTKQWGVGVCVLAVGQSNMLYTLSLAGSYNDTVPGSSPSQTEYEYWYAGKANATQFGINGFFHPTNGAPGGGSGVNPIGGGTLSTMRILARALQTKHGKLIPVAFIPWAESGKSIGQMSPDGSISSPLFNGSGTTAGTMGLKSPGNIYCGDFEGMVWHQGETGGDSRAAYLQALKDLYNNLLGRVTAYGRDAQNLFFLPAILGVYSDVSHVEGLRGAVLDLDAYARANNWPKVRAGWNCLDLNPALNGGDGLHFADPYRKWNLARLQQALMFGTGCSTSSARGPRISGIARAGDVLTVTVSHDGGTILAAKNSGAAITGWSVTNASGAVAATVAIASGNTITLTLPGGTAYPVSVKHGSGMNPDVSNLIYDDRTYPDGCTGTDVQTGLPLLPTPDAIVVN